MYLVCYIQGGYDYPTLLLGFVGDYRKVGCVVKQGIIQSDKRVAPRRSAVTHGWNTVVDSWQGVFHFVLFYSLNMLSTLRNAAVTSVRQSTAVSLRGMTYPLRRTFASENNTNGDNKEAEKADTANKDEQPAEKETEDASKLLAEKEKKIAELQVSE